MSDRAISRLGTLAVLLVAALTFTVSFLHIRDIGLTYGQPTLAAYLLPVSIDVAIVACSLALLRAARLAMDPPSLARLGLWSGVVATAAANVGFGVTANAGLGLAHEIIGSIVSGWSAYMFVTTAELSIVMIRKVTRHNRATKSAGADAPPEPLNQPATKPATRTIPATPVAPDMARTGRKRGTEPAGFPGAVDAYRASLETGRPLSERQLARDHLDGNRHAAKRAVLATMNGAVH